jgi:hypothetical protein
MSGGSHNTSTGLLLKFVCPKFEEVLDDLDMKRNRKIAIMCHAIVCGNLILEVVTDYHAI